jgi:hypothetical protein
MAVTQKLDVPPGPFFTNVFGAIIGDIISAILPADLILAVNPASDSILARQMIAALRSRRTESTRPFFVSMTSTGDAATDSAFNKVSAPGPRTTMESERKFTRRRRATIRC